MDTLIASPEKFSTAAATAGMVPPPDTASTAEAATAPAKAGAGGGISQARREANRRNAQKSTGPRTKAGKAVAKMNAKKHGWLAQAVVVGGRAGQESNREFKELCREHYEHLQPVGPVEMMLVDQMVTTAWRLRRARKAEAGEIALAADGEDWQRKNDHPLCRMLLRPPHPALAAGGRQIADMAEGCDLLLELLANLRAEVAAGGELTEAAIEKFGVLLNGHAERFKSGLANLRTELAAKREMMEPAEWRARHQQAVFQHLDREIDGLDRRQQECEAQEMLETEARRSAGCLPAKLCVEKVLRYEAAMQREWHRSLNQLMQLQRRREQGESSREAGVREKVQGGGRPAGRRYGCCVGASGDGTVKTK